MKVRGEGEQRIVRVWSLSSRMEILVSGSGLLVSGSPFPTPTNNSSPCFIGIENWYWQHFHIGNIFDRPQINTYLHKSDL